MTRWMERKAMSMLVRMAVIALAAAAYGIGKLLGFW